MVLAGFIGFFSLADHLSEPPSRGLTTTAAASAGIRAAASRARYMLGSGGSAAAVAGSAAPADHPASSTQAVVQMTLNFMGARLLRLAQSGETLPAHPAAASGRFRQPQMGGDVLLSSLSRHAAVACLVVAFMSCASPAFAQSPSRTEGLLRKMTLDEKIGQLVQRAGGRSKALNSKLDDAELERVRAGSVGSYLHVAGAEPLGKLQKVRSEERRVGIPLLFAMDVVHGYRTIFPVPLALAATWAPESEERAARVAADEATSAGLHWTFAPMIDIARDPRWGRIVEGAGEDPYLGARMAVAQVNGFQGGNMLRPGSLMATTKHFGAYGAPVGGRDYNSADISERTLQEVYLPPFYAAARAGSGSFMAAFNDIAGVPTTANRDLVRGLLRERWGWQGLMVSDWGAIAELLNHGVTPDRAGAAVLALDASVDMDMVGDVYANDLKEAIAKDPARLRQLDEAVLRILRVKEQL